LAAELLDYITPFVVPGARTGDLDDMCDAFARERGGGRIADLERRLERHEQNWQRAKGFLAAASVVFAVIEVAVEAWHRH